MKRRSSARPRLPKSCTGVIAAAEGIDFRLSGFGTLGGVITNADAGYRATPRDGTGAGKKVDYGVDSRLGLQGNVKFNDMFSAVGQVLSTRHVDGHGLPEVTWLYGQADLPAGFKVKLGRVVLPVFLLSDSRAVGYTQFWQRAPVELYAFYIPASLDGGQAQYTGTLGPVTTTLQVSAGTTKTAFSYLGLVHENYKALKSVSLTAEYGDWLARAASTRGDLTVPEFRVAVKDRFDDLALQYDNGTLVANGEYIRRSATRLDTKGYSLAAGWRVGAWTPYLSTSAYTTFQQPRGSTQAIGLRWDAVKNVAVKVQAAKVIGFVETFAKPSREFLATTPSVHVLSLGVDFVF